MFKDLLIDQLTLKAEEQLIGPASETSGLPERKKGRPSDNSLARFVGNTHLVKYVEEDRRYVVCSKPPLRKRTNFVCIALSRPSTSSPQGLLPKVPHSRCYRGSVGFMDY
ncbi:hypothetical protein PoB_005586900 [Plakobranchus ocellatus]|uniref:Uncharacterized protein n=1 Tax=Plakobranchus ocellatus TaxID=259542 RepID=A0AAV4CE03_9GAST|nr:hypothetical protein PoB_005586900 [Plakobranchus ocellatus]